MNDTPGSHGAAQQLNDVMAAEQQSGRPMLPRATAAACALAAGVATVLLGQPWSGGVRTAALIGALALLLVAFGVPNLLRRRAGLHGYRGRAARENVTFLGAGATLLAASLGTNSALAAIFDLLAVVVAYTWFAVLRSHRWTRV